MKMLLLACVAAALAAGAVAAARPAPLAVHSAAPDRVYRVLGTVGTLVEALLPGEDAAGAVVPLLAAEARLRHGRAVDAVIVTASDRLPNGSTIAARGLAIAWD